jgi:ABC-type Co2+ transport system permease subunit
MIVLAQDKHASNIADTDTSQDKKSLFDNVSFAAVIASALAAATSLFLSTKIGLAGSIIGAAVAAGASSLAMQVYQSILSKSAEKIRHFSSAEDGADDLTTSRQASQADQTHTKELSSDATVVQLRPTSLVDATTPCATSASGTRIAPESLRRASSTHQSRTQHKRAIVIACLAAFAALAITALVISFATAGQGIGSTTTFSSRGEETATTTEDSSKENPQASTDSQKDSPSTTNTNGSESSSGSTSTSDNTGDSSSTSNADSGTSSSTTDSEENSSSQDSSSSSSGNSSDSGTSSSSQDSADSATSNGNSSSDSGQTSSSTATNSADTSSKNTSSKTSSSTN